ncbi:MAG: hypothetical protein QNK05_16995 [Myxococcota bacterium]|nr:hypothetical protein [Myxococcota bacterium]
MRYTSSYAAYRGMVRATYSSPVVLMLIAAVFGFALWHGREGLRQCEASCAALGHEYVTYAGGTRMRPESCRCCDRDWTPDAVCVDARQLAAGAPLARPDRRR